MYSSGVDRHLRDEKLSCVQQQATYNDIRMCSLIRMWSLTMALERRKVVHLLVDRDGDDGLVGLVEEQTALLSMSVR